MKLNLKPHKITSHIEYDEHGKNKPVSWLKKKKPSCGCLGVLLCEVHIMWLAA